MKLRLFLLLFVTLLLAGCSSRNPADYVWVSEERSNGQIVLQGDTLFDVYTQGETLFFTRKDAGMRFDLWMQEGKLVSFSRADTCISWAKYEGELVVIIARPNLRVTTTYNKIR